MSLEFTSAYYTFFHFHWNVAIVYCWRYEDQKFNWNFQSWNLKHIGSQTLQLNKPPHLKNNKVRIVLKLTLFTATTRALPTEKYFSFHHKHIIPWRNMSITAHVTIIKNWRKWNMEYKWIMSHWLKTREIIIHESYMNTYN